MRDLLTRYPALSDSVVTYSCDSFVDSKYVWKVGAMADQIDDLIVDTKLEPASQDHPKFKELKSLLPVTCTLSGPDDLEIYASPAFGTTHQEGVDLLMLVRGRRSEETIVLYEWVF